MDSLNKHKQSASKPTERSIGKPILERITRMKAVLQGLRVLMDQDLQPLGITTSQLRHCSLHSPVFLPDTGTFTQRRQRQFFTQRQHQRKTARIFFTILMPGPLFW